jgi:small GTP-binding protein
LQLWDTAGAEDYHRLRPLSYRGADVFLVCFSLTWPDSLRRVEDYWIPEIREHCPDTPCILVGLQCDKRPVVAANPDEWGRLGLEAVPSASGSAMKTVIQARSYVECSALMNTNVTELFDRAVRIALASRRPRQPPSESTELPLPQPPESPAVRPSRQLPSFL